MGRKARTGPQPARGSDHSQPLASGTTSGPLQQIRSPPSVAGFPEERTKSHASSSSVAVDGCVTPSLSPLLFSLFFSSFFLLLKGNDKQQHSTNCKYPSIARHTSKDQPIGLVICRRSSSCKPSAEHSHQQSRPSSFFHYELSLAAAGLDKRLRPKAQSPARRRCPPIHSFALRRPERLFILHPFLCQHILLALGTRSS